MDGSLAFVYVTVSWTIIAGGVIGLGMIVCSVLPGLPAPHGRVGWRASIWWGLFGVTLLVMLINLFNGLGDISSQLILILSLAVGFIRFLFAFIRDGVVRLVMRWQTLCLIGFFGILSLLVAGWALSTPTNYDTGLYHLGAIAYARDFAIIPGLANLHERFGFNSSMWPLSAGLGGLLPGWTNESFRFVSGFLVTLVGADLLLRIRSWSLAMRSPGSVIMILGMTLILGAMVQYPGRLLASSAQDSVALVLTLVAISYTADFVSDRDRSNWLAQVAIIATTLVAMTRPLGWIFTGATVVLILVLKVPTSSWPKALREMGTVTLAVVIAGIMMAWRDVVLSGWIGFPLGVLPLPVDWRVSDPSHAARDIQGWARTPFQSADVTLASGDWFPGWLERLPTDWVVPALGALVVVGLVLTVWVGRDSLSAWKLAAVILAPSATTLIVWFISAPDPRFAWGFILALGLVPIGMLAKYVKAQVIAMVVVVAGVGTLVIALARGSLTTWSFTAAPIPRVAVEYQTLFDGTVVVTPITGDQCWGVYPLCRPDYATRMVESRGDSLTAGFRPALVDSSS